MAKKKQKTEYKAPHISKRDLWLKHYLNSSNSLTFLNKTESARAAGYKVSKEMHLRHIGCQNSTILSDKIKEWLDESGLSENALKLKLLSLLEAKETKFQTLRGEIDEESLAPCIKKLAAAAQKKFSQSGDAYTEVESLLGIEVENKEIQRKTLDMALKVQEIYPSEKHDHNVHGNVQFVMELPPEDSEEGSDKTEIGEDNG